MDLKVKIANYLMKEQKVIKNTRFGAYLFQNYFEKKMDFANLIFLNICDLLTDLANDVTFTNISALKSTNKLFIEFVSFFNRYGKFALNTLFVDGYCVIGYGALGFKILIENQDYRKKTDGRFMKVEPMNPKLQIYVMRSETFQLTGMSDKALLNGYLTYLNNILNSSNTVTARLGAMIMASPLQSNNPAPDILLPEEVAELEKNTSENYGSLETQKQIQVWGRPMKFDTVSLSSIDNKMTEKIKTCVLAIADRIKVPANQIALIDALSSKAFANGSEMLQGDFAKYQSFERLLNCTFVRMAQYVGLRIDYKIYNKPEVKQEIQTPNGSETNQE